MRLATEISGKQSMTIRNNMNSYFKTNFQGILNMQTDIKTAISFANTACCNFGNISRMKLLLSNQKARITTTTKNCAKTLLLKNRGFLLLF